MPFIEPGPAANGPRPILKSVDSKTFRLRNELPYVIETSFIPRITEGHATGGDVHVRTNEVAYRVQPISDGWTKIVVQPHVESDPDSVTDLASIPWFLWSLLGPYGKQLRPALLHDRLCERAAEIRDNQGDRRGGRHLRREADAVFRRALSDENVWWYRRWIFWAGVSLGRYWDYRRIVAIILILQTVASTAAAYLGVLHMIRGNVLVATIFVLAPIFASLLWMRNYRLPLVATFASPIVLPFILASLLAAFLLWLPDELAWLYLRATQSAPMPPPELLPRRRLVQ